MSSQVKQQPKNIDLKEFLIKYLVHHFQVQKIYLIY